MNLDRVKEVTGMDFESLAGYWSKMSSAILEKVPRFLPTGIRKLHQLQLQMLELQFDCFWLMGRDRATGD